MFRFLENKLRGILHVEKFNHSSRRCLYFILLINVISSMMVTIFIPGFSLAATALKTTQSMMQLTVVAHLVGEIVGRLFCGPISDYIGNKKGIIPAVTVSILGLAGCLFAQSVEMLIVMRFIQAIGSGVVYVISLNYINSNFIGIAKCKAMSTLEMYQPIANLTAPVIGGVLCYFYGWRSIFLFLVIMQIIMRIIIGLYMPDDKIQIDKHKGIVIAIFNDYKKLIFNKFFLIYSIIPGFIVGGYLIYSSHVPEICEEFNQHSELNVVLLQSVPLIFNLISTSIYRYVVREYDISIARRVGIAANIFLAIFLSLLIFGVFTSNISFILIMMCIQCFGSAFIVPVSVLGAMETSTGKSGSSAAAIVVFRNIIMSICVSCAAINSGVKAFFVEVLFTVIIVLLLLGIRKLLNISS